MTRSVKDRALLDVLGLDGTHTVHPRKGQYVGLQIRDAAGRPVKFVTVKKLRELGQRWRVRAAEVMREDARVQALRSTVVEASP